MEVELEREKGPRDFVVTDGARMEEPAVGRLEMEELVVGCLEMLELDGGREMLERGLRGETLERGLRAVGPVARP